MLPSQRARYITLFVFGVLAVFFLAEREQRALRPAAISGALRQWTAAGGRGPLDARLLPNLTLEDFERRLTLDPIRLAFRDFNATYGVLRPPDGVCAGVRMVVYVMSMSDPQSALKRQFLRQLFAKETVGRNLLLRFFLGRRYDVQYEQLVPEMEQFGDIVYYNVGEYYRDNFYKWHAMHEWHLLNCAKVPYFLKLDDDTTVFYPRLFHWIERNFDNRTTGHDRYFVCPEMRRFKPRRQRQDKRWYISFREWPHRYWPTYCYGYFVLTTNDTVKTIVESTKLVNLVHMDDVLFTGIVAEKANVSVIHFPGVVPRISQNRECGSDGTPLRVACHLSKTEIQMKYDLVKIKRAVCR